VDGSQPPRRITSSAARRAASAWSPDGGRIAFSARREGDEVAQLYVLDLAAGGEAVRLTTLSTGASAPRWSPDGRTILFSSSLLPDAVGRLRAAGRRGTERGTGGTALACTTASPSATGTAGWTTPAAAVHHRRDARRRAGRPARPVPELVAEPGFDGSADLQAVWTPDGGRSSSSRHGPATRRRGPTCRRICSASVPRAASRSALTSGPDSYSRPRVQPGRPHALRRDQPGNEWVYNINRLVAFGWPDPRNAPASDGRLGPERLQSYEFSPDGRTVYLLAEDEGHDRVFAVPRRGGTPRAVTDGSKGVYSGLSVGGRGRDAVLVATWESATNPPELVRIDPRTGRHRCCPRSARGGGAPRPASRSRSSGSTRARAGASRTSSRCRRLRPERRYPLLVLMHGGPHGAWKDQFVIRWNYHLLARPGYVVLLTNFTGSTGFGEALRAGHPVRPARRPGTRDQRGRGRGDPPLPVHRRVRQAAGGASYGGHLAYWMQGTPTGTARSSPTPAR
jgi:dipeptidyl aminopeptidase/acylaminoacyl peptidase